MNAREEVVRLFAGHRIGDVLTLSGAGDHLDVAVRCSCGWTHSAGTIPKEPGALDGARSLLKSISAGHLADVIADPSRGLICPAPLAHVEVRRG